MSVIQANSYRVETKKWQDALAAERGRRDFEIKENGSEERQANSSARYVEATQPQTNATTLKEAIEFVPEWFVAEDEVTLGKRTPLIKAPLEQCFAVSGVSARAWW